MNYTKHHLKFGKNQADNLAYIGFRRRFFPVFYWCLVLSLPEVIRERDFLSKLRNSATVDVVLSSDVLYRKICLLVN